MHIKFITATCTMLICGTAAAIDLDLKSSTLQIGKQTLTPVAVTSPWRMEYRAGNRRFLVNKNEIAKPPQNNEPEWTVKSDDDHHLRWLAGDGENAYLVGYQVDSEGKFGKYDSPPRLRRLDLKSGAWLSDLPLPVGGYGLRSPDAVTSVLAEKGKVVVLTSLLRPNRGEGEEKALDAYEVRCFGTDLVKPMWAKVFPTVGERPYTGGHVWGIPPPQYAASAIEHLAWCGDTLLVCAEAMQPVLCLNDDTGSEIWRLERVWEFQRGFIGPSVWSHFISRFGTEDNGKDPTKMENGSKAYDSPGQCALVAGPVVVPLSWPRSNGSYSIFLAVAKGPPGQWAGYLSDCIVYEFDDHGNPVSMMTLPQMVEGWQHFVGQDEVVWKCQNDSFVKITAAPSPPTVQMGGGGPDGISYLAWFRRLSYTHSDAWLSTGKGCDTAAFGATHAFCLPTGGYIVRKDDSIYRFPISAVNLFTGLDSAMVLNVPYKGEVSVPEDNYSSFISDDGTENYETRAPHEATITELFADGGQVEIVLGTEKWAGSVKFDVAKTLSQLPISGERPQEVDTVKAARIRVKALPPDSLIGALHNACRGNDIAYFRALLEAGADPKDVADDGQTALMLAAAWGTAEMVDTLIKAGSDVNASDKDDKDGEVGPVLMWAAAGGGESKRKVKSLLRAGAKIDGTNKSGWDALMSAARAGDVPTVELLLKNGAKPSHQSAGGETALMVALEQGCGNVVKVLIEAGADVNAADNKGMTPLMHAANRANNADSVKTLLDSGANPNAKDKEGRTAIEIATAANATRIIELLKTATKN